MIRMGRSNKTEPQPAETTPYQESYAASQNNAYGGQAAQQTTAGRTAMTESESIARDIKEGRLSGFVGAGTMLTGETNFQAMLRIDGHLTGKVTSENGTLIIGSGGRVDADIMVSSASINGMVNGDITALERVELGRTARVIGNIHAPRIVIEDGALFEGTCSMIKAKESLEQRILDANRPQYVEQETEETASSNAIDDEENLYSEAATS